VYRWRAFVGFERMKFVGDRVAEFKADFKKEMPWKFTVETVEGLISINPGELCIEKMDSGLIVTKYREEIAACVSDDQVLFLYPATVWQHFKKRWFPKWLLKKCSVVYQKKTFRAAAWFPTIPVPRGLSEKVFVKLLKPKCTFESKNFNDDVVEAMIGIVPKNDCISKIGNILVTKCWGLQDARTIDELSNELYDFVRDFVLFGED